MQIEVNFLKDGQAGQAATIATQLAEFISAAQSSLHIAIYDFRLTKVHLSEPIVKALRQKASEIEVKIGFYAGRPTEQNAPDHGHFMTEMKIEDFIAVGGDPAPNGTQDFLTKAFADSKVQIKGIVGSKLMHNKYIVRDANTPKAVVWTGSTNFTDDAWTYQDNNILQINSSELSKFYETDFQELWTSGNIRSTGVNDKGTAQIGTIAVDVAFAPGEGQTIDQMIADLIGSAKRRIKVA